jgi:hypothetical protein
MFTNKYDKIQCNQEITITYENYLMVYRYSDLLPTNTNEELLRYIPLFVIFGQLSDER